MKKNRYNSTYLIKLTSTLVILFLICFGFTKAKASSSDWEITSSMNHNRAGHRAVLLDNGKVLAIGGRSDPTTYTLITELHDH